MLQRRLQNYHLRWSRRPQFKATQRQEERRHPLNALHVTSGAGMSDMS
jgi:hypothetical protein